MHAMKDLQEQPNKDIRRDSITFTDKRLLLSHVLSPLPIQFSPLMVDSNADSEASVEVLTHVSSSMAKKGKRNRRGARYIITAYDVTSLLYTIATI